MTARSWSFWARRDRDLARLNEIRQNWNRLGEIDPLWAVLADERKKGNGWDPAEFLETGVHEVDSLLGYLASLQLPQQRRRALDFGCGVGRVTQPLARYFEEACGVDIAPSMLRQAERFNRLGARCRFLLNQSDDLRLFPDAHFDLIYSVITLQHMPAGLFQGYLREFLRLLAEGGALVFQLPGEPRRFALWRRIFHFFHLRVYRRWLRRRYPWVEMHGMEKWQVVEALERLGGRILDIQPCTAAGPDWTSFRYCVVRRGGC